MAKKKSSKKKKNSNRRTRGHTQRKKRPIEKTPLYLAKIKLSEEVHAEAKRRNEEEELNEIVRVDNHGQHKSWTAKEVLYKRKGV